MDNAASLRPAAGMRLDRRLLGLMKRRRPAIALVVLLSLLLGITLCLAAWLLASVVAAVFLEGNSLSTVRPTLRALIGLALLRAVLVYSRERTASLLSTSIRLDLRQRLAEKIAALGPAFTRTASTGELTASLYDGVEALDPYFRKYLPQLLTTALIPIVVLLSVFPLDPLSGWVLLLTAPLIPFFMILIGRGANQQLQAQWTRLQAMSGFFLERLQGLRTLKILGRSADQLNRIRQISDQFRRSTLSVLRIAFLSALVLELAATISTAIIAVQIGLRLLNGQLTFAIGFFVLLLAPEYYLPMRQLGAHFHDSVSGLAAADHIFQLLNMEASDQTTDADHYEPPPNHDMSIRLEAVSFCYPDRHHAALVEVNLSLKPRQLTALVGPSGAGKTTLLHLLLKFIQPSSGTIRINGQTLDAFEASSWRRQLAYVPQQPFLLSASLADNIRFGQQETDDGQIARAAQRAGLAGLIKELPAGLNTQLGEGGFRLSGGQAQRVALARAFLHPSKLLLLDEPTSDLDPATERDILKIIDNLRKDRTTLWVSHRLNTTLEADQVVLMAQGRIVESGPPRQLLASGGRYSRLMESYPGSELV